jgi:hypothetical protein
MKEYRKPARHRHDLAFAGRTPSEVCTLREQAAKSATVCADCFQPLSASASVTMVERFVEAVPADPDWERPAYDRYLIVPICLSCWLINVQRFGSKFGDDQHENELLHCEGKIKRARCLGCARPLRLYHKHYRHLPRSKQICCSDCARKMRNESNRLRRRVEHAKVKCVVCREAFVPKRSDARTCGNRCRQQLHRRRQAMLDAEMLR